MRIKKEFLKYFLIVFILGSTATSFAYGVKKFQTSLSKPEKPSEEEKFPETGAPAETPPPVVPDMASLPETAEPKGKPVVQGDTSVKTAPQSVSSKYPIHKSITTTFFWAGEEAGQDNKNISNLPSAWDEQWVKHFGGVDDPKKRNGVFPAKFTPKENPFYFALPYNDFDNRGKRKPEAYSLIPWAKTKKWGAKESICKNQWIKIMKNGKAAYAQWQDVGPFREDDKNYVFGTALPKSKANKNAGLDISPAVKNQLGLKDVDSVDWQFVPAQDVPAGPWKKVITTSQVYWK